MERSAAGHPYEENRLVSVTITATGHRTEFTYDGLGRRVGIKEFDPDQTQTLQTTSDKKYLWIGTAITEERSGDDGGTLTKRFFAQGFVDSDGTILLYTRDHLGSIRELADMQQNIRARYDYDPYDIVTKVSGDRASDFLYTGHYWHGQSGLFLTLYRAYDPVLGRWISRDPIEEDGGLNLYAYVQNAPTSFTDGLGLAITMTGHSVWIAGHRHSAIRITPKNQKQWLDDPFWCKYFKANKDKNGCNYLTLSAGPNHGKLTKEVNKSTDVGNQQEEPDNLVSDGENEDVMIRQLLEAFSRYQDNVPYSYPPLDQGNYNSNSFAHGLINHVGWDMNIASPVRNLYTGWENPLPW